MSDSAKTAREIEDVLASIRRLVSESHAAPAQATHSAPSGPAAQRLVLTPALRVADPDDPWAPVPAPGSFEPASPATAEEEDPSWGLEDRLSDWGEIADRADDEVVEDAFAGQSAEPEAPLRADRPADTGRDAEGKLPDDFAATPRIAAEFEPETGDADWPDGSAGRALRDLALVRGQGGETAGEETATPAGGETTTGSKATDEMTPQDPSQQAADDPATQGFTPVFSRRIDVRRPVPDETANASGEGETPSGTGADDTHVEDLGEMRQPFTFPETEDGLLDEATLRDLIAEVVREELQGVLGQRITRNVRKMVRREIRLALAAEDFE